MHPRTKRSLLWGAIGLLSFLVLIQGYELVTANRVDWGIKLGVAVAVGVAAAVTTRQSEERLVEDDASQPVEDSENDGS